MAIGERLFLMVWAVLSNTKDFIVEYASDVLMTISSNTYKVLVSIGIFNDVNHQCSGNRQLSRRRRAYFRRVRRQMGIYSPVRNNKSKKTTNTSLLDQSKLFVTDEEDRLNLEKTMDNLVLNLSDGMDSTGRLEDLENELLLLKKQMALLVGTNSGGTSAGIGTSSNNSKKKQNRLTTGNNSNEPILQSLAQQQNPSNKSAPPPPPPLPPVSASFLSTGGSSSFKSSILNNSGTNTNTSQNNNGNNHDNNNGPSVATGNPAEQPPIKSKIERSMSLADIIKNTKREQLLRTTEIKRSPGGTPCKSNPRSKSLNMGANGFQSELFAAIQNKFKSSYMQESDSEDEDFNSPVAANKENASVVFNPVAGNKNVPLSPSSNRGVLQPLKV
jgi:hypothetical protein